MDIKKTEMPEAPMPRIAPAQLPKSENEPLPSDTFDPSHMTLPSKPPIADGELPEDETRLHRHPEISAASGKDSKKTMQGSGGVIPVLEEMPGQAGSPGPAPAGGPALKPQTPLYELESGGPGAEALHIVQEMLCFSGIKPAALATLTRDLTALPLHILRQLKEDGLDIVVLKEGQSLADTPILPAIKPEQYRALAEKGRKIFEEVALEEAAVTEQEKKSSIKDGNEDPFHLGMIEYWESQRLQQKLQERFIQENIGFSAVASREPLSLRDLAQSHKVEQESYREWEETLRTINEGFVDISDGMITARKGVILIPYTYYKGRPVSETTLNSYKHYDSKYVKDSLGLHLWEDRMVVLHEDYVTDPGLEVGHYRIVLHEVGHAIDHSMERMPGIGDRHAARVKDLYERDKRDLASGGQNRFISPRAMDNSREYFAEAVEAYMTVMMGDSQEYYKGANNHDDLKRINPEIFAVVDEIMKTDFTSRQSLANAAGLNITLSMSWE